ASFHFGRLLLLLLLSLLFHLRFGILLVLVFIPVLQCRFVDIGGAFVLLLFLHLIGVLTSSPFILITIVLITLTTIVVLMVFCLLVIFLFVVRYFRFLIFVHDHVVHF